MLRVFEDEIRAAPIDAVDRDLAVTKPAIAIAKLALIDDEDGVGLGAQHLRDPLHLAEQRLLGEVVVDDRDVVDSATLPSRSCRKSSRRRLCSSYCPQFAQQSLSARAARKAARTPPAFVLTSMRAAPSGVGCTS
jgi:hypothetical protein